MYKNNGSFLGGLPAWVTHSHLSNLQLGKQTLAIKFTLGVVAGELSK
jgi:hypothetical protein